MKFIVQDEILTRVIANNDEKEIIIPDGIKKIGENVFSKMSFIERVIFPESLQIIGESAFKLCNNLKYIIIPDGVTEIGNYAFSSSGLIYVKLSRNLNSIGLHAFFGTRITILTIPDNVTTLGYQAFAECIYLRKIVIGKSIEKITKDIFEYCFSLKRIIIPETVRKIESGTFCADYQKRIIFETSNTTYAYQYAIDNCISVDCDHKPITVFHEIKIKQRNEYGLSANYSGITLPYELEDKPVEILDESIDEIFCVIPSEFASDILRNGFIISEHWKDPNQIYPEEPSSRTVFTKHKYRKYKKNFMRVRINMNRAGIKNLSTGSDRFHILSLPDDSFIFSDAVLILPSNCLFLDHYICSANDASQGVLRFGNSHKNMIRHLVIPEDFRVINDYSFNDSNILQTLFIGENVRYAGSYSFSDCQELQDVYIGKSIGGEEHDLFCNCPKLSHVTIANELKIEIICSMDKQKRENISSWFQNCPNLVAIDFTDGTSISLRNWRTMLRMIK